MWLKRQKCHLVYAAVKYKQRRFLVHWAAAPYSPAERQPVI